VVGLIINIILSLILGRLMGPSGLALALAISSTINLMLLYFILHKHLGHLDQKNIFLSLLKIIGLSLVMALVIQVIKNFLGMNVNMQKFGGVLVQSVLAGLIGAIVYFILSIIFKAQEVELVKRYLRKFFHR
jgi:peptidoglycan biosynthesis protein MviN/MurJ (putative lipid II flippase)